VNFLVNVYKLKTIIVNEGAMFIDFSYHRLRQLAMAAVLLIIASSALAEDAESGLPKFSINGFGTLGAVNHNEKGVRFRRDISQAGGANAGEVSFVQDSMLGVQLTAYLNPKLEVSTQVVSRQTTDNNFDPQVTWAYLKFKLTEDVAIRVGRLGAEEYPQGDSAEIGYANLMIRQPIIFYPRTFDGIDAEVSHPFGGGMTRLKGMAGWTQGKLIGFGASYDTGGSKLIGGVAEYTHGGWTGRVVLGSVQLHNEIEELKSGSQFLAGLSMTPHGTQTINRLSTNNRMIQMSSLSLAYDAGRLQGIASYNTEMSSNWPCQHLLYANVGYRIGQVTPYVSWSEQHTARNFTSTGIPNGLSQQTDALNQGALLAQSGLMVNQSDIAFGARYDFAKNTALKFQVDHIRYKDPSSIIDSGFLTDPVENRNTKSLTLISLALDFVF